MGIHKEHTLAGTIPAILVELNYKGSIFRFALTENEFEKEYPRTARMYKPLTCANTNTLRPLVHIWFAPCLVNDKLWMKFFSDMSYGLSEKDLEMKNLAYIDKDRFGELRKYIDKN